MMSLCPPPPREVQSGSHDGLQRRSQSAWCGYQASRWNDREGELAQQSSDERVEASRFFGLASQKVAYDSNMLVQYAQAAQVNNQPLITILLAVGLFFAGVTSSFKYYPARVLMVVLALATVASAGTRLADLPLL